MAASTREQRMAYVENNIETYYEFLKQVDNSNFSPRDMMEFAAISANTSMSSAIDGFLASRDRGTVEEIGEALLFWGVNAPFMKASYCRGIRELPNNLMPNTLSSFRNQRYSNVNQIKGLGYAKYSFAVCPMYPYESDIVCIDTHMYQTIVGKMPNVKNIYGKSKKCIRRYERIESILRGEAERLGVPAFLYQWAVWDMQRGKKERHDFLWQSGRNEYPLMMDGVEIAG